MPTVDHPIIIACDPGIKNFGVATYYESVRSWQLEDAVLYDNPVTDLVSPQYQNQVSEFQREWTIRFAPIGVQGILAIERFQPRGHRNAAAERINIMIGILTAWALEKQWQVQLVTAATWKNAFHRTFQEGALLQLYKEIEATPHQIDAALIGRYIVDKFAAFKITTAWKATLAKEWL